MLCHWWGSTKRRRLFVDPYSIDTSRIDGGTNDERSTCLPQTVRNVRPTQNSFSPPSSLVFGEKWDWQKIPRGYDSCEMSCKSPPWDRLLIVKLASSFLQDGTKDSENCTPQLVTFHIYNTYQSILIVYNGSIFYLDTYLGVSVLLWTFISSIASMLDSGPRLTSFCCFWHFSGLRGKYEIVMSVTFDPSPCIESDSCPLGKHCQHASHSLIIQPNPLSFSHSIGLLCSN
jgi:hypothetical protein